MCSHSPDVLELCGASGTFTTIIMTLLTCEGLEGEKTSETSLLLFLAAPLLHGWNISARCFKHLMINVLFYVRNFSFKHQHAPWKAAALFLVGSKGLFFFSRFLEERSNFHLFEYFYKTHNLL